MCNGLHKDSVRIRETGYGYKIFVKMNDDRYYPLITRDANNRYKQYTTEAGADCGLCLGERVIWIDKLAENKDDIGFCFLLNKKEAAKAMKGFSFKKGLVMKKIRYFGGLGKHIETEFVSDEEVKIALCKGFQIIEEEEENK